MSDSKAESATVGLEFVGRSVTLVMSGTHWRWSGGGGSLSGEVMLGGKFNELMPILTMRRTSAKGEGEDVRKACVQSVMMYGSETWAMKVEDIQKFKRTEVGLP